MDTKKSNKIREIVRLKQILKKWKKLANANANLPPKSTTTSSSTCSTSNNGSKSIKFLKKTLSFSDMMSVSADVVPKGFVAVCVGRELKRFIVPTEYLGHKAFGMLLREAEEEFGFEQEGVLKIPCAVALFEKVLKMVQEKRDVFYLHDCFVFNEECNYDHKECPTKCWSPDCDLTPSHHPQMCR